MIHRHTYIKDGTTMMIKIVPILQNNEIVQYDFKNLKIGIAMSSLLYHIPITELESDANAQIHCD